MLDKRDRDPLAITIGVSGIIFQLLVWVFLGGRVMEKLDNLSRRVDAQEVVIEASSRVNALQDRDIAVISTKLDDIKSDTSKTNRKLDAMR